MRLRAEAKVTSTQMLSLTQNIIIVVLVMAAALAFMALINWLWPAERRYAKEDLIGWQLNILATTHAVILGFMFYTEWTSFQAAQMNVEFEANAVRNLYRLAEGLPASTRARLEEQTHAYVAAVVSNDWPQLARGRIPEFSHQINESMWKTLMSMQEGSAVQITALDHALTELSSMTQCRRTRLLQAATRLPAIFWCVLIVGGALTVASVTMFGSRNPRLHAFQVFSLTLLVTLAMLSIADLDHPFQGWVHISSYAFERARDNMSEAR